MEDRHARYRSADGDRRRRPSSGFRTADAAQFHEAVERALVSLPRGLLAYLDGTRVAVEDLPPLDTTAGTAWPPLGRYREAPSGQRPSADAVRGTLTLYRYPLQTRARDRADLEDLIREVVVDDLARRFDLDDDRLDELGWG